MSVGSGFYTFAWYKRAVPVWLAGREINTDIDALAAAIEQAHPPTSSTVRTGDGVVVHDAAPSPLAPAQAAHRVEFPLTAIQLDSDTALHYMAVGQAGGYDLPKLWLPWPWLVTWRIVAGRVTYTTPYFIAGSAGERTGGYFEPIVHVRNRGTLVTELAFSGSPGVDEFGLTSITADSREILAGDISAHDGLQLYAWIYALVEVEVLSFTQGQVGPGAWNATLQLATAPSPAGYEADT